MNAAQPQPPALPAPPQNIEAEAMLLGGLMVANGAIDRVADRLTPDEFYEPLHARIFSAIVKEHSLGRPVNPVTLKQYFTDDAGIQDVGGPAYLVTLTSNAAVALAIDGCADQLVELAARRRLALAMHEIMTKACGYDTTVADLLASIETATADATRHDGGTVSLSASECIANALKAIEAQVPGVACDIAALNDAMGPIRRKNMAVVAGRPGMGKTLLALNYARSVAQAGKGVLFITLEMSAEELGERLVSDLTWDEDRGSGVPYDRITSGNLDSLHWQQLIRARDAAAELPLQVIDAPGMTPQRLAALVRRWKRRFEARGTPLELVVVDYLQKMRVPGTTNRFEIVTEASQAIKETAKENDLGIMAVAQLSRKVEERQDKRPIMADLRESGQVEQDADVITFVFREEYYLEQSQPHQHDPKHADWQSAMEDVRGRIDFICAKRRKGKPRSTHGRFYGAYQAVRG